MTDLIPPFRFALVEKDLYRGAYPRENNLRFLKRLRLRSIVSLLPKEPSAEIVQFCREQRIELRHFTVPKFKEGETPLGAAEAQTLLELLIDPRHQPLYVHCLDGVHNTGMLIMLLRKLQCWNLSAVIAEFTRFVRGASITSGESQFVERFRGIGNGIQLPAVLPPWLWDGQIHAKHPTLLVQLHPDALLELHRRVSSTKLSRLFGNSTVLAASPGLALGSLDSNAQPSAANGRAMRTASRSDSESDDGGKDGASPPGTLRTIRTNSQADGAFTNADGVEQEAVSVSRDFVALDLSLSGAAQLVKKR
jgi:tyrosine-protein phosphatase OCA6